MNQIITTPEKKAKLCKNCGSIIDITQTQCPYCWLPFRKATAYIAISLLLFSIGCSHFKLHPRPWKKEEKVAAGFFVGAHIVNAYSTKRHQDYPDRFYEINPILGRHPSKGKIGIYFSLSGIGTLLIAHFYPELRFPLLTISGLVNCGATIHDLNLIKRKADIKILLPNQSPKPQSKVSKCE